MERDQGLRRQPLNSPFCNLQKHVSRWLVVPGEGFMQVRGLEASQTNNKAVCLSYIGYSLNEDTGKGGKGRGVSRSQSSLARKGDS